MNEPLQPIDLDQAFAGIPEQWSPRVAGRVGACEIKLARIEGEFIWHCHEAEDEMFLIVRGKLEMRLRGQSPVILERGQLLIVPAGTEHCPVAHGDTWVLLVEPAGTLNTGNVRNERTIPEPARLDDV